MDESKNHMSHKHTLLFFDCRPMKAACHRLIDQVELGELGPIDAMAMFQDLAATLPDLDSKTFGSHVGKLTMARNFDRAHKLVNALGDKTLRPGARLAFVVGYLAVKWGLIFGVIALIVWLVAG